MRRRPPKAGISMGKDKVALGIDYGTESGRVVVVRVRDGEQIASAIVPYADGVIDERLPKGPRLEPDWALQNPRDYLLVVEKGVPKALKAARVKGENVIGIGTDFTASSPMPTKRDGNGEQADRPASRHCHAQSCNFPCQHRMHSVPERVEHRRVFHGDRRIDFPNVRLGDFDEFRKAAIGVHADDANILADVPLACPALKTTAAGQVHLGRHKIPLAHDFNFRSHPNHRPAEFVAEN